MKTKNNFITLILIIGLFYLMACSPYENNHNRISEIRTIDHHDFVKVSKKFSNGKNANELCSFEFKGTFKTDETLKDDFDKVILVCKSEELSLRNIIKTSEYLTSIVPDEKSSLNGFSSKQKLLFSIMKVVLQRKSLTLANHLTSIKMCYDQFAKYQPSDFLNLYNINISCNEVLYIIDNRLNSHAENLSKTYAQLAAAEYLNVNKNAATELRVILEYILNAEVNEDIDFKYMLKFKSYIRFQYIKLNDDGESDLTEKLRARAKEIENEAQI